MLRLRSEAMAHNEPATFEEFRKQLRAVLRAGRKELSAMDQDRIRQAVRLRRSHPEQATEQYLRSPAGEHGGRVFAIFDQAEAELGPKRADKLVPLIDEELEPEPEARPPRP